jgi:hypothetical protein
MVLKPSTKLEENLMELIKPERPKRELTQFTVTVDQDWKRELWASAQKLDMTFHALIKAILFTYLKKKEQQETEELKNE